MRGLEALLRLLREGEGLEREGWGQRERGLGREGERAGGKEGERGGERERGTDGESPLLPCRTVQGSGLSVVGSEVEDSL